MRKKLSLLLAIFACTASAAACAPKHVHAYDVLKHDVSGHWYECSCGEKSADGVLVHSGGTATCKEKAECSLCHEEYGEVDANNHESADYKYQSNNDGTHKKLHKCCNAVEVAAEACNGGEASCQEKAECSLCSEEYGALGEHAYAWDYSGSEYDVYKCTTAGCEHEDADKKFKKVVSKTQYIVKDSATASISLEGVGTYSSVVSVKLGDVSLGTNLSSLNLSGVTQEIGDKSLSIVVKDADNAEHTVTAPVAFITGYIETAEQFIANVRAQSKNIENVYYVLKNDITLTNHKDLKVEGHIDWNEFSGTFDGNGHKITSKCIYTGAFVGLKKATVRNLTIVDQWLSSGGDTTLVARDIQESTLENITVQIVNGNGFDKGAQATGCFSSSRFVNNTVKNLHVEAERYKIGSLFGGNSGHGFGSQYNTFTGCWIKCQELQEFGHGVAHWNNGSTDSITQLNGFVINPAQDAE